jgi:hypothetical protein
MTARHDTILLMSRLRSLISAVAVTASLLLFTPLATRAHALSVVPPTFSELVAEAQTVFVGRVTSLVSLWTGAGAQRRIVTDITLAVESTIKGDGAAERTLRFLGGTADGETLLVPGMPQFTLGDRAVLFVTGDTNAISPLVGVRHGRFPVHRAPDGYDYVTFHDGRTFSDIYQVGRAAITVSRTPIRPMRREDFEREVQLAIRRGRGGR